MVKDVFFFEFSIYVFNLKMFFAIKNLNYLISCRREEDESGFFAVYAPLFLSVFLNVNLNITVMEAFVKKKSGMAFENSCRFHYNICALNTFILFLRVRFAALLWRNDAIVPLT